MRVITGSSNDFSTIAFGETSKRVKHYLEDRYERAMARVGSMTDSARAFLERSYSNFQEIHSDKRRNRARALLDTTEAIFLDDVVRELIDIEDFRQARLHEQRWVMADPVTRNMYHKQLLDGYSDTYVDLEPGLLADDHYDYRRVVDGIITSTEDGGYERSHYVDDLRNGDTPLEIEDQGRILNRWEIQRMFINVMREDPTNPNGGNL